MYYMSHRGYIKGLEAEWSTSLQFLYIHLTHYAFKPSIYETCIKASFAFSLFLTLSVILSYALSFFLPISCSHTHSLSHLHNLKIPFALSLSLPLTNCLTLSFLFSYSLYYFLTPFCSLYLSLSYMRHR